MPATRASNDEKLLQEIAAGSMEAISDFYRQHESRVYRFAMSKVADPHVAADILNDVMLEVWRSAARFEGRAKVTTWLLGIAHNKIVDYWRKLGKRDYVEVDENLQDESTSANPELAVAGASDGKLLQLCMEKLKPDQREILHLVFFEELNYSEIANIIQVPEGTVKSRVFHARNAIKKHLTQAMRLQV